MNRTLINTLKKDILQSPLIKLWTYNLHILNHNDCIVGIQLTGSAMMQTDDDQSDIDIVVWTTSTFSTDSYYTAEYKGKYVHWWFEPIDLTFFLSSDTFSRTRMYYIGLASLINLQAEDWIYLNPDYIEWYNYFMKKKDAIAYGAVAFTLVNNSQKIQLIANNDTFYSKLDWIYEYYYNIITNQSINYEFIRRIKRGLMTNNDRILLSKHIQYLIHWFQKKWIQYKTAWLTYSLWVTTWLQNRTPKI